MTNNALGQVCLQLGETESSIAFLQDQIQSAHERKDLKTQTKCFYYLGQALFKTQDTAQAQTIFEQSISLAQKVQNFPCLALSYQGLSHTLAKHQEMEKEINKQKLKKTKRTHINIYIYIQYIFYNL